ncbi:hypothetical protein [Streptomyces virginiae]|uniref:hypothetical protein n=1 Tax=Streptomyces virginiae TaxID=1961 RepID=UPI00324D12FD
MRANFWQLQWHYDKDDHGPYEGVDAAHWAGMKEAGFDQDLDVAVRWDEEALYFFKDPLHVGYNIPADKVEPATRSRSSSTGTDSPGPARVLGAWIA